MTTLYTLIMLMILEIYLGVMMIVTEIRNICEELKKMNGDKE